MYMHCVHDCTCTVGYERPYDQRMGSSFQFGSYVPYVIPAEWPDVASVVLVVSKSSNKVFKKNSLMKVNIVSRIFNYLHTSGAEKYCKEILHFIHQNV